MQTRAIWTNLDMEYALRHGGDWHPPAPVRAHLQRWEWLLRALPECRDAGSWRPSATSPSPDRLVCWGIDERVPPAHRTCSIEASAAANDKRTSAAIAAQMGLGLPGVQLVRSVEACREYIAHTPFEWIAKHPMGVSGRERVGGRQGELPDRLARWIERALAGPDAALIMEPRISSLREYSAHAEIDDRGRVRWIGWCALACDGDGTLRGHRVTWRDVHGPIDERRRREQALLEGALVELWRRTGYVGPVSVDGFRGEIEGEPVERLLSEINARYTFGRIALEIARAHLHETQTACEWRHARARDARRDLTPIDAVAPEVMGEFGLPRLVDPDGRTGAWLARYRDRS